MIVSGWLLGVYAAAAVLGAIVLAAVVAHVSWARAERRRQRRRGGLLDMSGWRW